MKYKYIDCHSHPHDKKFLEAGIDADQMMKELVEDGGATIAIGTDYTETKKAIEFAKKYDNCWVTIGIHPADNHAEIFDESRFAELLSKGEYLDPRGSRLNKVVAIGECGLDYYYFDKKYLSLSEAEKEKSIEQEKARQKELFVKQIEFALKHNLPLVLHGRPSKNSMDAYRDMLDILEKYCSTQMSDKELVDSRALEGASPSLTLSSPSSLSSNNISNLRGHAHFFVGNLEIAKRFLELGFLLSFDGPITFTNEYDKVIEFVPIEKILIETDSPYAAPMPHRGQLNFPKYVKEVAKKIAVLKNISVEEVLEITKNNAISLFNLE